MANWCQNRFTVHGAPDAVLAFIDQATGGNPDDLAAFEFHNLRPMPASMKGGNAWFRLQRFGLLAAMIYFPKADEAFSELTLDKISEGRFPAPRTRAEARDALEAFEVRNAFELGELRMLGRTWRNNVAKYGVGEAHAWRICYWGCKHDLERQVGGGYEQGDPYATVEFDTAWNPPSELFKYLVTSYPDIQFKGYFQEPGNGVYGCWGNEWEGVVVDLDREGARAISDWPFHIEDVADEDITEAEDGPLATGAMVSGSATPTTMPPTAGPRPGP